MANRMLVPPEPEPLTPENAQEILKELEAFRKTKLFAYLIDRQRLELFESLQAILDVEPRTEADYRNREALLGEARFRDVLIYKISGEVEEAMNNLISPKQHDEHEMEQLE
jgi:hypothetical protein